MQLCIDDSNYVSAVRSHLKWGRKRAGQNGKGHPAELALTLKLCSQWTSSRNENLFQWWVRSWFTLLTVNIEFNSIKLCIWSQLRAFTEIFPFSECSCCKYVDWVERRLTHFCPWHPEPMLQHFSYMVLLQFQAISDFILSTTCTLI